MAKKNKFTQAVRNNSFQHLKSNSIDSVYTNTRRVHLIDINNIIDNPKQPRLELNNIDDLKNSIKSLGLIQPLTVTKYNDKFLLICGHRRLQALKELGKQEVEVIIDTNATDKDMQMKALAENLQRDELEPLELAFAYKDIIEQNNLTLDELSNEINKSKAHVSQILGILKLDNTVISLIKEDKYKTLQVLNKLNKVDNQKQVKIYNSVKSLSRDDALEYINKYLLSKVDNNNHKNYSLKEKKGKFNLSININAISKNEAKQATSDLLKLIEELKHISDT